MLWFILWVLFAFTVLVVMGWSINILLAQKKAWGEFAAKYKLEILKGERLMSPIAVTGQLQGRQLNIYSVAESGQAQKTQRIFTHIEVFLNSNPPALALIAKRAVPEFLGDVPLPERLTMTSPDWPKPEVAMTNDPYALANWLHGGRLRALRGFMDAAGRGEEPILVADGVQNFLLWRTDDPMRDPRLLNAQVQKMFAWAKDMDVHDQVSTSAKPNNPSDTVSPDISA